MRKMKDSGIEWIGQIPENWEVGKLQWNMEEIVEKNSPVRMEMVLSLTKEKGVIPYDEKGNQGNKSKENLEEYKIAYKNTIVANSMNILIGSVGISRYDGCVSPVYYVFKNNKNTDLRFLNYIFSTIPFQKQLRKYANGILEIRLRVSSENIMKQLVALPSVMEQEKISDFLDSKIKDIDAIIMKIKESIEEYKKYKQSVLTEAVTKGLDKSAPMKDSGIEWIGQIPEGWKVVKMHYVADFYNGDRSSKYPSGDDIVDEGVLFVTSNNLGNIFLNLNIDTNKFITEEKYNELGGAKIQLNDIIFCLRGSVGKCAINKVVNAGTVASSLVDIRATNINADFLNFILQNPKITELATLSAIGIGSLNLAAQDVGDIYVPVPSEKEQIEISNYLLVKCKEIEELIAKKEAFVEEMEAYKKSLIYEYVTGKKEVL